MNKRLNWIDAMRALTMVSVVLVHVLVGGFGINSERSALCILRTTFTLPLFFFVSGFFLFRPLDDWTRIRVTKAVRVRTTALVAGTIVFSSAYFLISSTQKNFSWIHAGDFRQYWYTFSLFQMFVYYLILIGIAKLLHSQKVFWILLSAAVIASWIGTYYDYHYWCSWVLNQKTVLYFQFFALGMAVRRFQEPFLAMIEKPAALTVILICYIASLYAGFGISGYGDTYPMHILQLAVRNISCSFFGIMLLINIFYNAREFFDRDTRIVRGWRFIGQRTLDIYFLHYFLIPRMRYMAPYMSKGNTLLTELTAGLLITALIIAIVMALSHLLRRAPLIRNLLGAK